MTAAVHTAGRLHDTLQPMKAELVKQAYEQVAADETVTLSDVDQAMDFVMSKFAGQDPRLDAKVAVRNVDSIFAFGHLSRSDVVATAAAFLSMGLGLALMFKGGPPPPGTHYLAGVPPILLISFGMGRGPTRGAPVEAASQAVLQRAQELAGMPKAES